MLGNTEPRIFTPPLRELTPETSLGFAVVDFAREMLGINLLPWEEWFFVHALEITGDASKWRFRFRKVVVMVARQNGKTMMSAVLAAYFICVLQAKRVLGTSLNLGASKEVWELFNSYIDGSPELSAEVIKHSLVNGQEGTKFTGDRKYRIASVTGSGKDKGGRGQGNDLVLLDELREHKTWQAWRATTKSTNARPHGMVFCFTNAGGQDSVVLKQLRVNAHRRLGDPDGIVSAIADKLPPIPDGIELDDTLGWFEWSAAPERGIYDVDGWCEANPSLGYGFLDERTILSDAQSDDEVGFRTEDLCQFVEAIVAKPFPGKSWELGTDSRSEIPMSAKVFFGIDISADRTITSIAACGLRSDGAWHVEVVENGIGTDWAVQWLADRADASNPLPLAWQANGAPVSSIGDRLSSMPGIDAHPLKGAELTGACGRFYDSVSACDQGTGSDVACVFHRPQPVLDMAAKVAVEKKVGDGGKVWDRRESAVDISPLMACAMAFGLATSDHEEEVTIPPSAYDDGHDMLFFT